MPRGRKPKPPEIKKLTGNAGKRKIPEYEVVAPQGVPDCPSHLTGEAQLEWDRISAELGRLDLLHTTDRAALAAYCVCYARWVDAEKRLAKFGYVIKTSNGNVVQSPFLSIANKSLELMHKFLTEFGLTPVSRLRIGGKSKSGDDFDDFLKAPVIDQ